MREVGRGAWERRGGKLSAAHQPSLIIALRRQVEYENKKKRSRKVNDMEVERMAQRPLAEKVMSSPPLAPILHICTIAVETTQPPATPPGFPARPRHQLANQSSCACSMSIFSALMRRCRDCW
jgi:hypothetical protein